MAQKSFGAARRPWGQPRGGGGFRGGRGGGFGGGFGGGANRFQPYSR